MAMDNCIFCKIVAGEIPCYKVFEDDDFIGFLDIRPVRSGHVLVVPKKHYRWVYDIKEDYSESVAKVAAALKKAYSTELVVSYVIGDEVPHAHIHLVPRTEGDGHGALVDLTLAKEVSKEEMEAEFQKILSGF